MKAGLQEKVTRKNNAVEIQKTLALKYSYWEQRQTLSCHCMKSLVLLQKHFPFDHRDSFILWKYFKVEHVLINFMSVMHFTMTIKGKFFRIESCLGFLVASGLLSLIVIISNFWQSLLHIITTFTLHLLSEINYLESSLSTYSFPSDLVFIVNIGF